MMRWRQITIGILVALCVVSFACLASCGGGGRVGANSPHVESVTFSSSSSMTETSQVAEIKISFDAPISVSGDVLSDLKIKLNGADLPDGVSATARPSANMVTIDLAPTGKGLFALYQSSISIAAAASDGSLPHVAGASGDAAVIEEPIEGTLPSGLAISVTRVQPGDTASNTPATTIFEVTSSAKIRAITWISCDGGATKLLKHNHNFATNTVEDCASDLANVITKGNVGLTAQARGNVVTITANNVVEGQVIDPIVVEGVGVESGTYDAAVDGQG